MSDNTQIKFLADVPEHLPTLAQWTCAAWGQYDPTLNLQVATESLKSKLNKTEIPLTFVAMNNGKPVGMVSLKPKIKLDGYSDRKIWLGSLWVADGYRNQGIGTQLLNTAYKKAKELGFIKVSLFASDPEAAFWYEGQGWKKFATDTYQGHPVTLLEYNL